MSKPNTIKKSYFPLVLLLCSVAFGQDAFAAKMAPRERPQSESRASSSSSSSSSLSQAMLVDLSAHYMRDTKPDGKSDTAGRFSIGGMFNEYIGLDVQGMFAAKSKDYLIGADLRFAPTEWFFVKGGVGGYAQRDTRELSFTPLAGAGIMATVAQGYYFVTETSYFQMNQRNNISFGVGLGCIF